MLRIIKATVYNWTIILSTTAKDLNTFVIVRFQLLIHLQECPFWLYFHFVKNDSLLILKIHLQNKVCKREGVWILVHEVHSYITPEMRSHCSFFSSAVMSTSMHSCSPHTIQIRAAMFIVQFLFLFVSLLNCEYDWGHGPRSSQEIKQIYLWVGLQTIQQSKWCKSPLFSQVAWSPDLSRETAQWLKKA